MRVSKMIVPGFAAAALAGAVLVSAVGPRPAQAQGTGASEMEARTITVLGQGEASARPDQAHLTFGVVEQGESASAAVEATSAAMSEVIAGMRELGAEDRDLQTATFQISPRYAEPDQTQPAPRGPNEIVGYEARNTLTVTVRDTSEIGAFLDRAIALGVNEGGDVRFSIENDGDLLNEARRSAIEDGRAKAELYAEAAGASLGTIVSISEPTGDGPDYPQPMMRMASAEAGSGVPIEAGELTRSAAIRIVFSIDPSN